MADRPILFSGPMVRALLDGRKTQTRRVLKPVPYLVGDVWWIEDTHSGSCHLDDVVNDRAGCMKYQAGDRLWVREAFSYDRIDVDHDGFMPAWFWADGNPEYGDWTKPKPSIHMPRTYSRLTLIVTDVRVQRLQEINEADAQDEGCDEGELCKPIFRRLWDRLNADRGYGWAENPWVVALTFTVHQQNIDAMKEAA